MRTFEQLAAEFIERTLVPSVVSYWRDAPKREQARAAEANRRARESEPARLKILQEAIGQECRSLLDACVLAEPCLRHSQVEWLAALCVDRSCVVVDVRLFRGAIDFVEVDVAELRDWCASSSTLYALHNHPDGCSEASEDDERVTEALEEQIPSFAGHAVIVPSRDRRADFLVHVVGEGTTYALAEPAPAQAASRRRR